MLICNRIIINNFELYLDNRYEYSHNVTPFTLPSDLGYYIISIYPIFLIIDNHYGCFLINPIK